MQTEEKKPKTKKDAYVCPELHTTITEVIHDGRVPNIVICPKCGQYAQTLNFLVNQNFEAVMEWYKPTDAELLTITTGLTKPEANRIFDHVNKGLLMCREKVKKNDD